MTDEIKRAWRNGEFNASCVCGGSIKRPNTDCERCMQMRWICKQAAEIERLGKPGVPANCLACRAKEAEIERLCFERDGLKSEIERLRADVERLNTVNIGLDEEHGVMERERDEAREAARRYWRVILDDMPTTGRLLDEDDTLLPWLVEEEWGDA